MIPMIVLTGGPCGGKSTILPLAKQWLEDHGYTVGILHMPEPLEIERKYLVTVPKRGGIAKLIPQDAVAVQIEQTYLTPAPNEPERRVRQRLLDGVASYYYTMKQATGTPGVRVEKERQLDRGEYERLLKEQAPGTVTLKKTRYCFPYEGRHFELDVFDSGLVLLEIELSAIDEQVKLPYAERYLTDVTGDPDYSNRKLATITPVNDRPRRTRAKRANKDRLK